MDRGMTFQGPELARNAGNHTALSPVSILKRVERVHPEQPAQIYGRIQRIWSEVAARCKRLSHAGARLAGYMRLKKVIFGELPKTTTGKIRKNELLDLVRQQSSPLTL
jgi:acyl-CoA synthetase (AMP-forming)/AMP-acid ligase II